MKKRYSHYSRFLFFGLGAITSNLLLAFTIFTLFFGLLLTVLLPSFAVADEPGIKFRIIVGEFADKSQHTWYHGPTPGTGLAGYHGLAGNQIIDGVLEDVQTSFSASGDGSDQGYYDTNMSFTVSLGETT